MEPCIMVPPFLMLFSDLSIFFNAIFAT